MAERLVIPLTPEAKFQDLIEQFKNMPGFLGGYWGLSEEANNTLEVVLCKWLRPGTCATKLTMKLAVWESLEKSTSAAILELTKPISHDPITGYHINFNPSIPSTILTSPIVEMLTFHDLPADFTEEGLAGFLAMVSSTEGCLGIAKGPVIEEANGGHAWLVMIGWESLEANVKGQKSEAFAKAPKLHVKTEMHHVKFQAI